MTEFFKDIGLSANSISGNYALKKIGELYEEVQEIENVGLYTVPIENPKTIGEDDLVMWFDPSNPLLVSVDGTGAVVNDTQGIALRDKSKYGNSLSVPAGASGITYDSEKRMLACSGNTNTSYLHTLALEPAVHWTTANSSFTYFIVIEEKRWTGGVPAVRGLLNFFYTAPVAGQQTYSGILSDTNADQWTYAPVDSMGTAVCHPNNAGFNFEYKAIIAMTYGVDAGGLPFRDLYYNGLFCGRQSNLTGLSNRNQSFILGGYDLLGTYQRYTGFIGEQCLFKRALTRTEIVRMTEYLNAKWEVFAPRECDIFCVGGQSNAVGFAGGAVPPELKTNGTIGGYYLDPQYWYTANETPISCFRPTSSGAISFYLPSDVNAPTNLTTTAPATAGCSLWANFGDEYYKKTGRYAVFLYTGRPGTSMIGSTQWNPIAFRNGTTNYWTDVKNILSPAVLKLQTNGWEVKHKFFLWNQGENSGDRNNVNNAQLFQDAIDLVLDTFGYERYFFYIIANTTLTPEGNNYSQITQQTYTFPRPDVHMVFDCSVFTKWGAYPFPIAPLTNAYMADDSHYTRLGYAIAGSESGKQAGEIVNQFSTITIRDVNTTTAPTVVYPRYDVRFWGAVGNGVADDTLAIQNAINANSRCVYFPAGVYAITGPITATSKNNFKLVGDGATILRIGAGVTNQNLILSGCSFCRVENLKILQSLTATGGGNRCIDMIDCFGCVINGCDIGGDGASSGIGPVIGINMNTSSANAEYLQFGNTITNCNIYRCQWGLRIQGTTRNTLIQGCSFSYNNLNSVWCQTQTYFTTIVDCNFSASATAVKVEGSGLSAVVECDRATVSGCTFKNISVCGVYCQNIKFGVNIVGCHFSVSGDNVGLGWTWNPSNNPVPSSLPANARWGVFLQATRNVNITGCIFDGCTYGIGYNGAPLTNITGCTFNTNPTLSVAHIWENRVEIVVGPDTYTTGQCVVSNNTFDGDYVGVVSNYLQKAIRFDTSVATKFSIEWSIYNNTRTTGFNELTFTDSLPNGTYVIDANYDTVNIDLTLGAGKVLQISPTMFGRTFTLSAFTEDSQIGAGQLNFAFTGNYTGNQVPLIRCGGISYDSVSRTYTILRTGNYYFSNLNSSQNQWVITSDSYPITPTGVFTINYTVDTRIPKMLYISGSRTLTFPNAGTFGIFRYGFSFDFTITDVSADDISIVNTTGENMNIRFTRTHTLEVILNGNTFVINNNSDRYYIYRAVFVYNGAGTTSWIIHQI